MYLKRIELSGFKSFADRTEMEFVPGITAVVGPNGSGKSNISDAIRWVLGEQSAKSLRGGKMEDVIFAGSDTRKPVSVGTVAITLDNSDGTLPIDYSEVTVTRILHRSGESEYMINKQPCRLKDITELFMDTGIGKEAYSIIGQGRIEEILSTKSEDRRSIFEEASGIVKYKTRKKESEKKLEVTEQNLIRLHDLISELENQLEPLGQQAEKARLYKRLKEELASHEISLYVFEIERLYRSWKEGDEVRQRLKNRQAELSAAVGRRDAELEKRRWELRLLEEKLDKLHQQLLKFSEEYDRCLSHGEVLEERKKNLSEQRGLVLKSMEVYKQRLEERKAELDAYRQKWMEVCARLEEEQKALLDEEERLRHFVELSGEPEEESLKRELMDVLNQLAYHRNEVRYAKQQMEDIAKKESKLLEDYTLWLERKEKLLKQKEESEHELKEAAKAVEQSKARQISLNQEVQGKHRLLEQAILVVRQWEQKLQALISRKETLTELENDYDGYAAGVRAVLGSRKRIGGIHGAVVELIRVPEELEAAMETALGSALQHIVVENEAVGREVISYLKQRKGGRVTVLPMNVLKPRFLSGDELKSVQAAEGFVGIAQDLISFDKRYQSVIGHLLGNVIIAQTLEQANRIAALCKYRYRVVTLEGDVVNAGGSMTGGSLLKKGTSLLARRRQIDELEKEIEKAREHLATLRDKAEALEKEWQEASHELEKIRLFAEQKRLEQQGISGEIQRMEQELENIRSQLELHIREQQSVQGEKLHWEGQIRRGTDELNRLELEEIRLQEAIEEAERKRKAQESEREQIQERITSLKVKAAATLQEKLSMEEQLRRFELDLEAIQKEREQQQRQLERLEQDLTESEQERVRQIERLNELEIQKQDCSRQLETLRNQRLEQVQKMEADENETKGIRGELHKTEEELHQIEVKLNRLDVELDTLLKKLGETYEISFELAKERYPLQGDVIHVQSRVRELKQEIASLGEVNLGAIEEFERIQERYRFLNEQKNDLVQAKETLYQVIREMDQEMSKRFKNTFEEIRQQFQKVFAKLFGGGRADLILTEPDNLLETGIDIVAQPPGKKLQNLSLLSGGERALTAIALLFAILHVKPVPFCVLDEVEAALDEANVSRFASYLREFSSVTQFIVVTHRKGTMEEADVLYGVTMEEDGVSKLVSVRLEEESFISA